MKKSTKIKIYIIVACVALAVIGFFASLNNYSSTPINPTGNKDAVVLVDITTGTSFLRTIEILNEAGVVKNRFLFCCLALKKSAIGSIRAGKYQFSGSMTPSAVIGALLRGEIKIYRVSIHEDLTTKEIAERLAEFKLIDKETIMALAVDRDFLNSLGIKAKSIEGYLFPETYYFDSSMSEPQIMRIMVNQFWKKVTPEMLKRAEELGFDANQFVTFASLVGKESGIHAAKPQISAIFHDRLKKGIPLQSSLTAVYDLEDFNGIVSKSHLKRNSPYNTFIIRGLPPGPIANPGMDSFKAALYPAKD